MKLPVADRCLRVVTACTTLVALVAPSRAEDLSFSGTGTVRILASDWAEYLGGDSTFAGANDGGRLFYRGSAGAGDGNYIHFNLARLQGLTMQSNASVTLQNTNATWGGGVDGSFIATANGAWTAAGGASLPGATAIGDAANATGSYGSGASISWGIGASTFQGYVNNASSFNGLAVIGGAGSQMHFNAPLSPYLSVATNATMNGVVTVAGGNAWNSSNYSFTDGVLSINDAVAEGNSGAGAVTINALGTVFVNGNYNKYWAIDSTRINTGGVLFGYGHSNLNSLTLAGGELAGIRPDGTYGTWALNNATTVTGGVTSTISAQQVIFSNGTFNIDAGSTLNFTGSVRGGTIAPTIAAGGKLINGAAAGTSLGLGNVTLTGGELAATAQPNAAYGNYQLNGSLTVSGSTMSTISADIRMGADRTFDVGDVDGGSGVDLLVSGGIGHNNGVAWGYVTKTGAGTMKVTGVNGLGGMTVSAGRLVLEDAGIGDFPSTFLTNNAALELGVTTGSRTTSAPIGGSGSLTKTGAGTLVLTAESSYTGGTVVDAGVLSVAGGSGRGRIRGALTVNTNGTVEVTGDGSGLGYQDQISSVAINGGTLTSAGAQHIWNISGGITMTGGTLQSNNGVSDPNGPQLEWNRTSVSTLASASSSVIGGRIRMRADGGSSGISFNVEDGAAASDLLVSAAVTEGSGGMGITKSGAGTMALTGVNSYSGVTTLSGGVVNAATFANNGSASSLGVGTGDTDANSIGLLFRGGTLQYTGSTAQSTNRSIRVSTEGGGATIDASGSNPDATLTFSAASSTNFLENPGNRTVTFTGNNTGNNTFAMAIIEVGSTAVVKSGAGTWVLSGNSSYTGGTTINGGVLSVQKIADSGESNIGTSGGVTFGGGALRFTGANGSTGRSLAFGGAGTIDVADGSALSLTGGGWSGSGGFTKTGAGTMTVAANASDRFTVDSTRGGTFTMAAGTFTVANTSYFVLGDDGGSATFNQSGGTVNVNVNEGLYVGNGANSASTMNVSGGTLNFTGNRMRIGQAANSVGTVNVGGGSALATVNLPQINFSEATSSAQGFLNLLTNGVLTVGQVSRGAGAGTITFDGGTLRATADNASFVSGLTAANLNAGGGTIDTQGYTVGISQGLGGVGGLTKNGVGTLSLSGGNTYSGATVVNAGVLALPGGDWVTGNPWGAGGATGAITVGPGATLSTSDGVTQLKNGLTLNGGTLSSRGLVYAGAWRNIVLSSDVSAGGTATSTIASAMNLDGTRTFAVGEGSTLNVTGELASWYGNGGGLAKAGAGTLVLAGQNSYSGVTTVGGGALRLESTSALGSGGLSMDNGTTLQLRSDGDATFAGGNNLGGLGNASITIDVDQLTSGNNGKTLSFAPSGFNTYQTTINVTGGNGYTLAIGGINEGFGGGLALNANSANLRVGAIGSASGVSSLTVSGSADTTVTGAVATSGGLTKNGAGSLYLNAASSYSGGTTLNAGRLVAGSTGAFGSGSVTIAGGTLDLGGLAIANTIVNNGGSIVNAAAYAGSQSVAGTTVFTGTVGGTVTVDAGGTLKGSDTTFAGPVSIGNGGVHSPGTSPGSQTFTSGLSYSGSSSLTWELIANTTSGPGTNYDFISVTGGDLTIDPGASLSLEFLNTGASASTVNWGDSFWDVGRTWTLIDFTSGGSSTGDFTLAGSPSTWLDSGSTSLATARPSASFSVANQGGDVVLTYAIVPEPGSIALVGIGVGLAAIAIRRRRSA